MVESVGGPLAGKRIVVTRRRADAEELCVRLAALGATPVCAPVIDAVAIASPALDQALSHLIAKPNRVGAGVTLSASEESHYSWLVFTSAAAVEFFFARIAELPFLVRLPPVAVMGPATAARLWSLAQVSALLPPEATGAVLGRVLPLAPGDRVLLPRAQDADPEIGAALRERGALLDDIAIYSTIAVTLPPVALAEMATGIDILTFTSPSTVQAFFSQLAPEQIGSASIVCIGPTTARAVQARGLPVAAIARQASTDGLIEALIDLCGKQKG